MRITARSPDGVIEGLESIGDEWWVMAVQWHPEEMTGSTEPWDRGLFKAFAQQIGA
jgi:gamma-glutamyl-gamma-aminobutyrate hydrolase PuuD